MDHHWVDGVGQKKSETLRKTRLRVQAGNCTEKAPKKGNISGWGPLAFGSCVGAAVVQNAQKRRKRGSLLILSSRFRQNFAVSVSLLAPSAEELAS